MTSGGAVNVKLTAAADVEPRGEYVLTSGLDFTGKTVNLVDPPDWGDAWMLSTAILC